MSAPRFFLPLLAVLAAALVAGGCAAPGAQRLQGPPEGMPPSLQYVTADVLGFTLYATDVDEWPGATQLAAGPVLEELHESIGMTVEQVDPWIGDHAGIAVRQLEVPGADDDTAAYVADVRDRTASEDALEDAGWTYEDEGPEDLPTVNGDAAELLSRPDGRFRAAAVFDDGLLVARSTDGLRDFLEAADEYAVAERRAMSQYAADVAQKVPAGAVFRFDFLRTQLRRPFQEDPALLEFARWATESRVLLAARDGWVGLAPGADDDEARIIGAFEWVPDLAPDVEWNPAERDLLDEVGAADAAIAIDDPGQHVAELVRGITFNNGQYATEQDVPDEDGRVELEPYLDDLDGQSAIGVTRDPSALGVVVRDAADEEERFGALFDDLGVDATVEGFDGLLRIRVPLGGDQGRPVGSLEDIGASRAAATGRAGEPPRPPIAWIWARSIADCGGPAAGWLTFDGEGEMTFAVGVDVTGTFVRPPTAGFVSIAPEFCDVGALVPFT